MDDIPKKKFRIYSEEERTKLIEDFKTSKMNVTTFSASRGVSNGMIQRWMKSRGDTFRIVTKRSKKSSDNGNREKAMEKLSVLTGGSAQGERIKELEAQVTKLEQMILKLIREGT